MYLCANDSVEAVENFLQGLWTACAAFGHTFPFSTVWCDVRELRGWRTGPISPAVEMQERGMENAAIVDERLCLHIELMRRMPLTETAQ